MNISGTPTISLSQEPEVVKVRNCIDRHFPDLQIIEYTNTLHHGVEWSVTDQFGTNFASDQTKRSDSDIKKSWILIRQAYRDSGETRSWSQFPWTDFTMTPRYRKLKDSYSVIELDCLLDKLKKDSLGHFYGLLRFTSQEHIKSFPVNF